MSDQKREIIWEQYKASMEIAEENLSKVLDPARVTLDRAEEAYVEKRRHLWEEYYKTALPISEVGPDAYDRVEEADMAAYEELEQARREY